MYYGNLSFLKKYFKNTENWLLVFKNNAQKVFLALGYNGKLILAGEKKNVGPPCPTL
jgi:hypothetical protein